MTRKSVFCIATSEYQAAAIVDRLKSAGFANNEISALFPGPAGTRDFAGVKGTKAPEVAANGAGTGAVFGGALGSLAGLGVLAIPGMGPLVAAGPLAGMVSGTSLGGALGGIAGALIGMGIPEYEARRYEGKVEAGAILISVHTNDADEARLAQDIFRDEAAADIAATSESAAAEREVTC